MADEINDLANITVTSHLLIRCKDTDQVLLNKTDDIKINNNRMLGDNTSDVGE